MILFGTICKSSTVQHASYHSTILQYFFAIEIKLKNKYTIFRKAQRAACKGSKSRGLATPYGAPFVKKLYRTDLAQKLLSLPRDS